MSDEQLALLTVSEAQQILEKNFEPRPQNSERRIIGQLVEILERPDLFVAVGRLQPQVISELL